jgi:excisionase family DNA binding protein
MNLLTYRQLGRELSLSVRYLQKCVQKEELPHIRFGKAVRFDPEAIQQWVEKRCKGTESTPKTNISNEKE